jgi:hypothetical protein
VVHRLESAPLVFTLQLAWESHREEVVDIAATLAAVDEQVRLAETAGPFSFAASPPFALRKGIPASAV